MKLIKLILILILLPCISWAAKVYDSSSFINMQNYKGQGLCHLSGDVKDIDFDPSASTKSCSVAFGTNYVLIGVSTQKGQTKTIHCQKLICSYEPDTSKKENFYTLPE